MGVVRYANDIVAYMVVFFSICLSTVFYYLPQWAKEYEMLGSIPYWPFYLAIIGAAVSFAIMVFLIYKKSKQNDTVQPQTTEIENIRNDVRDLHNQLHDILKILVEKK